MSNRKQIRAYYNALPEIKMRKSLQFMHPENIAARKDNRNTGTEMHDNHVENIQQSIFENHVEEETKLKDYLKINGLNKKQIDEYLEIWSNLIMWPAPKNKIELRKKLKSLNKTYNING